ncbi:hypothetical protein GCM10022215_06110 [Nocardioides fonticola]|uniref:Resolvase/invertase-type recombinase catalytic domain-containing protein n=1 Tax=Nocardioides fonticola TaxID=450363 RepID=A0ABP7XCE8_9ACTN
MPVEVCIYVRLSYDLHGNELGVERQERECREYADARGWTVHEVYIDNDLSATTGVERPEFERLLASKPAAILCWHLDRLLRVSGDLERVIALGVDVFSKEAGWFDLSNPAGRAVARTVTAWSTCEGEQKAIRQKAAHRQRVDAGGLTATGRPWWPTRPLGFNLDGTHHEVEAPALRQVYADLLKGGTLAAGVRHLESCGIVTQRSLDLDAKKAEEEGREPVGRPWEASSLSRASEREERRHLRLQRRGEWSRRVGADREGGSVSGRRPHPHQPCSTPQRRELRRLREEDEPADRPSEMLEV